MKVTLHATLNNESCPRGVTPRYPGVPDPCARVAREDLTSLPVQFYNVIVYTKACFVRKL